MKQSFTIDKFAFIIESINFSSGSICHILFDSIVGLINSMVKTKVKTKVKDLSHLCIIDLTVNYCFFVSSLVVN
jgi:hypothetical protein